MSALTAGEGLRGICRRGPLSTAWLLGVASQWQLGKVLARLGSVAAPRAAGAGTDGADHPRLRGFHRSGPGTLRPGAPAGTRGRTGPTPAVSRAFSHRPLEGCGPGPRGALSMVRVERPAGPCRARCSLSPSCSPTFQLSPSHCLWPLGSRLSFLLGFLLLFFGLLLVFLSPLPPLANPPPLPLSGLWGFRTVRLDIFGLCRFGEWMEFLLTWGRRPANHLLTKVPPVIKPPFIHGAHTLHSFTSCHFIYCFVLFFPFKMGFIKEVRLRGKKEKRAP